MNRSLRHWLAGLAVIAGLMATAAAPVGAQGEEATPVASPSPMANGTPGAHQGMHQDETHGTSTGAVFMTIENQGDAPDRLTVASTDAAAVAEIHEVSEDDGIMRMRPLADGLEIAPGETVTLAPGDYHLMLIGLTESLITDQTFEITLTFEQAGEISIEVVVGSGNEPPESLSAEPATAGDIVVSEAWSRPAPKLD